MMAKVRWAATAADHVSTQLRDDPERRTTPRWRSAPDAVSELTEDDMWKVAEGDPSEPDESDYEDDNDDDEDWDWDDEDDDEGWN